MAAKPHDTSWTGHHMLSTAVITAHVDVFNAAVKAGWHVDAIGNLIALPNTTLGQAILAVRDLHRPVHRGVHPQWDTAGHTAMDQLRRELVLRELVDSPGDPAYDNAAKALLDELQDHLRARLVTMRSLA